MASSVVRATVRAVSKRKLQATRAALTLVSARRGEAVNGRGVEPLTAAGGRVGGEPLTAVGGGEPLTAASGDGGRCGGGRECAAGA